MRRKDASWIFTFPSGSYHPHPSTFTIVRRLGRAKEYSWKNLRGGGCETLTNVSKSSGSHKDGLGLHYVACEESLEGNLPQSRIGGLRGNLAFHCQRDRYQKDRARLFIVVCSCGMREHGHNWGDSDRRSRGGEGRIVLRIIKCWSRLPRESVDLCPWRFQDLRTMPWTSWSDCRAAPLWAALEIRGPFWPKMFCNHLAYFSHLRNHKLIFSH